MFNHKAENCGTGSDNEEGLNNKAWRCYKHSTLYDNHRGLPLADVDAVQLQRLIHLLHGILWQRPQGSCGDRVQNLRKGIGGSCFTKREILPCALSCRDLLIGGCSFGEAGDRPRCTGARTCLCGIEMNSRELKPQLIQACYREVNTGARR